MAETRLRTLNNLRWRYVPVIRALENQNIISHVVGHPEIAGVRIKYDSAGPIEERLRALDDADGSGITVRIQRVHVNGGWENLARTGYIGIAPIAPGTNEHQLSFEVESDAMSVVEIGVRTLKGPKWLILPRGILVEHVDLGRVLQ